MVTFHSLGGNKTKWYKPLGKNTWKGRGTCPFYFSPSLSIWTSNAVECAKEDLLTRARNGFVSCWLLLMLVLFIPTQLWSLLHFMWKEALLSSRSYRSEHHEHIWTWIPTMSKRIIQFCYHWLGIWQIYNALPGGTCLFHLDPPNKRRSTPALLFFPCPNVIRDLSFILNCLC